MAEASPAAPALRLHDVSFSFADRPVISDIHLQLEAGTFFSLLGPSGGGKTTLLKLIGGYLRPTSGHIHLRQRDVTPLPPERRDIGMVFQSYALFPHMTARENVSFGLQMRRLARAECRRRTEAMLDRVGLTSDERGRRPTQLSGGQQQRVALARALVIEPSLLLLDEPLANLDRHLREQLRGELKDLQRRSGVTTLLVTHDRDEALSLADRVGVLAAGRLLQAGPPLEVYQRPCCPHVARLLGDANLFTVQETAGDQALLDGGLRIPQGPAHTWRVGDRLMLRPEQCRLRTDAAGSDHGWPGRVIAANYLGSDWLVDVAVGTSRTLRARQRALPVDLLQPGSPIMLEVPPEALWRIPEPDPPDLSLSAEEALSPAI